jgi:hypothetical protein
VTGPDPVESLRAFARAVFGGCSGFVEVAYIVRGKTKSTHIPIGEFIDDPTPLLSLAETGIDVYLGCTTLSEKPDKGRGKSLLRVDLPGVWLDLDLDVEGHHKKRDDQLPHLASVDQAQELLAKTGLPDPTALVHSGGGLYAWWLFDQPPPAPGRRPGPHGRCLPLRGGQRARVRDGPRDGCRRRQGRETSSASCARREA